MRGISRRQAALATLSLLAGCAHQPISRGRPVRPDDPALDGSLTLAQARELWGRSDSYSGPQWEYVDYPLEGAEHGHVLLWFQPEAPHQLRRVLIADLSEFPPDYRVVLNLLPETESRTVEEIPSRRPLRVRDLAGVWGPPDAQFGSGLEVWSYLLADGRSAEMTVRYGPPGVISTLRVVSADRKIEWELNQ